MANNSDISYSQIYSLTDLISAPLIATVQADFYAAERFVSYLRQYGFETPAGGLPLDFGTLKMISFQYRTAEGWMEMQVPLISLIPLPLLAVSDADFNYSLKLLGSMIPQQPSRDPADAKPKPIGDSVEPRNLLGSFAPLRPQSEVEDQTPTLVANMEISIRMRQSDIPGGIATLLNIVQSSVGGNSSDRITVQPNLPVLSADAPSVETRIALFDLEEKPLAEHLFRLTAEPDAHTAYLRPPVVKEGALLYAATPFDLQILTNAEGYAKVLWERVGNPDRSIEVNIEAISKVNFRGGQHGTVKAGAQLQIIPNPK